MRYIEATEHSVINFGRWLLLVIPLTALPATAAAPDESSSVMLAVVSRDGSLLTGGVSSGGRQTKAGTVYVEPFARISATGEWGRIPCNYDDTDRTRCVKFGATYLNKRHVYTLVGAVGQAATITAEPTRLDECYGYTGKGTYTGAPVSSAAIAAESSDLFDSVMPPAPLSANRVAKVREAVLNPGPDRRDTVRDMRFLSVQMDGIERIVAVRTFGDYAGRPESDVLHPSFILGEMKRERFKIDYTKKEEDEDERIVGNVRLKGGHDFLITSVSGPESQRFRVYGVRGEKVVLIFQGGGSSC